MSCSAARLIAAGLLVLPITAQAEDLLVRGRDEFLGHARVGPGGAISFLDCDNRAIPIDGGAVRETTLKCPAGKRFITRTPPDGQPGGEIDFDRLVGAEVLGNSQQKLGQIERIISSPGQVEAVVVEAGGFLGIGSRTVAIPWNQIQVTGQGGDVNVVAKLSRDDFEKLPDLGESGRM